MAKWGLADTHSVLSMLKGKGLWQSTGMYKSTSVEMEDCVNKDREKRGLGVLSWYCINYNLNRLKEDKLLRYEPSGRVFKADNWSITEKGKKEDKIITLKLEIVSLEEESQSVGVTG